MAPDGDAGGDSGDAFGDGRSDPGNSGNYGANTTSQADADAAANASFADNAGWGGIGVDVSDPFGPTSAFGNLGGYGQDATPGLGDVAGKIGSFIEGRVQSMIDNPGASLTNFGVGGILGGAPLGLAALGPVGMGIAAANTIAGAIFGQDNTIGGMLFGGTPEGWSPAQDDDAGAVNSAANTAFADAAGIGGIGNNTSYGDPSSMGPGGDGYMPRDPSNTMAQQAVAASAAPPPSLFQPQQPQQQPWRPNMWSGNNFIMPRIG